MPRRTEVFLPTLRDDPADSESLSHKLLLRAGMVRQLGAGLWTYLPAGYRAVQKTEQIIREEMTAIGGQEVLLPLMQPADIWRQTQRYEIDEMFKLQDRKESELVLGMTHEEPVTWHVAREVRSYRDLPMILFQIQLKERDEPRPRAGVLRTREFTMKDSYSFDRDAEGLEESYEKHIGAYDRIFDRCDLDWHRVSSDVGMMGGAGADEYMAPCPAGEDSIALADGYSANAEIAVGSPLPIEMPAQADSCSSVETPGLKSVEEVAGALGVSEGALIKAVPVVAEERGLVLALVRGDDSLNELKLSNLLGEPVRQAGVEEIEAEIGPAGYIGPIGVDCPIVCDLAIEGRSYVCGANEVDRHLTGVDPGRDFKAERADIRNVKSGDTSPNGQRLEIVPAIEIGNIFKLGTRYSEPLGATFLDESGKEKPIVMGSYGIGPARIIAASVEQRADEKGISWPRSIAPWEVALIALSKAGEPEREAADAAYEQLSEAGLDVLYDDRDASAGEKLTDAELIGCPVRVVAGKRSLGEGRLEATVRKSGDESSIPVGDVVVGVESLLDSLD